MEALSGASDETLCGLAAEGDPVAEEYLTTRYSRLVRICARPYFLAGGDSEDLIQEGMIGLLSAIRRFSPDKEVSFRTYAEVCIRNRLRSTVKAAARGKHAPLNYSVSLGTPLFDRSSESCLYSAPYQHGENPEDMLIQREEWDSRVQVLRNRLSDFERTVLHFYLDGLSYGEIAAQTDRAVKSVDNAVQRIRRKAAPFFSSGDISVS